MTAAASHSQIKIYAPRSIKRSRRSRSEIEAIRVALYQVLADDNPMTVRQVFYRLVSSGAIAKTEMEYKQTVVRLLTEMRRDREIPFHWIADNTRWMRKPRTYHSLRSMLKITRDTCRRELWSNQPAYVEVWLEKDALAGVTVPGDGAVGRALDGDARILFNLVLARSRRSDGRHWQARVRVLFR